MTNAILAQTTSPSKPVYEVLLENAFALGLVFIFLTAIIAAIVARRRKDKCLKLFNHYPVSYLGVAGRTLWGTLKTYSQGLNLQFDEPYQTRHGVIKTSAMLYEADLNNCLVICRFADAMDERQRNRRTRQVQRCFRLGLLRRLVRTIRNLFNTLKDAITKAFSTILGQIAKTSPAGSVISSHRSNIGQIGQTLLGTGANAYEPMLESYIGKPVVVRLNNPNDPDKTPMELPGFLADYSNKYVAVFNLKHEPLERIELVVTESTQCPGFKVDLEQDHIIITCTGPDAVAIQRCESGKHVLRPRLPLTKHCAMKLRRQPEQSVRLIVERTQRIDVVCPRAHATIEFGGAIGGCGPMLWSTANGPTGSAVPAKRAPTQEASSAVS